jgi:hypothetical protein
MRPLPAALFACALAAGCGGGRPAAVSPPSYDPEAMGRAAVKQYDRNGNGTIEGAELDACPGLKRSLAAVDKNGDKAVSADELADRFKAYQSTGVGAVNVPCKVTLNGNTLEGATVTFVPEDFMLGTVKGASGKTDANGYADLAPEGGGIGVPLGFYKITVTKDGESIPARYNTLTTLGAEVNADARGNRNVELHLKSP